MGKERRAEMERKGALRTTVQEFLGLDDADRLVVELWVRVAKEVRRRRLAAKMSQKTLAERIRVSQPTTPSIESGASVSLETVMLAFFATGGILSDLAAIVAEPG